MTATLIVDGWLLAMVAAAAVIDLKAGTVPNWLTYPSVVLGLAVWGIVAGWPGFGSSAAGLAVGFVPLFVFYRMGAGLGGGDVKLMGAVGALRGWPFILAAMFYSFIVAAVVGVALMIWRGQTRATLRRIGRTLKSVALPGVAVVSPSSPESIQVPFAACVCLGTAWALIESAMKHSLWEAIRQLL
jgi:prepilin peptidase CpaA